MNHYVYLLSSKLEEKYYIGVRSCKCRVSEDFYMGSSKYVDKNNCNKIILKRFDSRKEAVAYEIELHNKFDVAKNPLFWNRAKQTSTGFDTAGTKCSVEHVEKVRQAHLGRVKTEKECENISKALKGRTFSDKHKENLSKALTGRSVHNKGIPMDQKQKDKLYVAVECIETGQTFKSLQEASEWCNLKSLASISAVLNGYRKSAGGYTWRKI